MFLAINLYQSLKEMHKADKVGDGGSVSADIEIIQVDRIPYHQLLQEIHLVVAGYRMPEKISFPINSLIDGTEIRFIQSNVEEIRADENKVMLD
jgi:NADH dehydrogenase FAD-containing subunit